MNDYIVKLYIYSENVWVSCDVRVSAIDNEEAEARAIYKCEYAGFATGDVINVIQQDKPPSDQMVLDFDSIMGAIIMLNSYTIMAFMGGEL